MELKKGYKQTEVGIIPENWKILKLGDIGKTFGGLSGKSKDDFKDGVFPYIPFMNIMINPIIDSNYFDYVNLKYGESQNSALKGDLFFNGSSETPEEVGMCSVLLEDIPTLYLNSFCFGFRLQKDLDIDGLYLSYYFRSKEGRKLFFSMAQGATRYNLSKANFNRISIPIPPLPEQTAIAEALSDMDVLITQTEKLIEKKKAIKQGMMQELLTPKEGWVFKRLGDICSIYQPQTISQDKFTQEGYLVYGANGVIGYYHSFNHKEWQVMITCRGSTCGTVNKSNNKCWITGNAMVMNVDSNSNIDKNFFYYLLKKQDFTSTITGSGQPQIVRDPLYNFRVHLPIDIIEQQHIVKILLNVDKSIDLSSKKLVKLKHTKQGMMQALLTGKTRLI